MIRAPFVLALLAALPSFGAAAEVLHTTRETRSALPGGDEADGMIGDWVMRNDRVVAVLGDVRPEREANQMTEMVQGVVIDFTPRGANNDQLTAYYPMGVHATEANADRVDVIRASGGTAEISFSRAPTAQEPWGAQTTYTLRDGDGFLHVRTEFTNGGSKALTVPIDDRLKCDNDVRCIQAGGEHPVILMEDKFAHAAYGVSSDDGRTFFVEPPPTATYRELGVHIDYPGTDTAKRRSFTLAPGQKIELNRILIVAKDAAAVQSIAYRYLGQIHPTQNPPAAAGVADPGGQRPQPVTAFDSASKAPISDAFLTISKDGHYISSATTSADGTASLPLSPGTYDLKAEQIGRAPVVQPLTVATERATVALEMSPRSEVDLDVREAGTGVRMPVKVEFRNRVAKGKARLGPYLGPEKRANGAGDQFYSRTGQDTIPIPPGDYEAHISRGGEYTVVIQTVHVGVGDHVPLRAELTREVQSPHWIMADCHNHDTNSGDSNAWVPAKVLNLSGGGIEFAPATNHNRISTYAPTIHALGLDAFIASCPGIELSGRPGPGATNHQTSFPLSMHDDRQGYGAPRTDVNPYVQMSRLFHFDDGSAKLMQQNHPNIGWLYYDRDRTGVGKIGGGYGTEAFTDVLEVRETMQDILHETDPATKQHRSRSFWWLQMLNQGIRIFGVANSDAHAIGPACGSIWNYVHVADDTPARADPWEIARSMRNGHVVMSNGPFMEVSLDGGIPGDTVKAPAGRRVLRVKVQMASWSRIDRVQVLINGRQLPAANFTRTNHPKAFGDGVIQFDQAIPLDLQSDAAIVVVAAGEHETVGALLGGKFFTAKPIAVSNPIFVDIGGHGWKPSGDLLGVPLPSGKGGGAADEGS